jgi:hypothetical protein
MAYCYQCGRYLPPRRHQERRKVKTGESVRRYPVTFRRSATNLHYGMRVVCPSCARRLDRHFRLGELWGWLQVAIAILLLFMLICMALGPVYSQVVR